MIFPWQTDYAKDAMALTKKDVLELLVDAFPMRPLPDVEHFGDMLKDSTYLVLEAEKGREWVRKIHKSRGSYDHVDGLYDCDDREAQFRNDRIVGRMKYEFEHPEAFGGLHYFSNRLQSWHWDAWAVLHHDGVPSVVNYMCQPGFWVRTGSEVVTVRYFDA